MFAEAIRVEDENPAEAVRLREQALALRPPRSRSAFPSWRAIPTGRTPKRSCMRRTSRA